MCTRDTKSSAGERETEIKTRALFVWSLIIAAARCSAPNSRCAIEREVNFSSQRVVDFLLSPRGGVCRSKRLESVRKGVFHSMPQFAGACASVQAKMLSVSWKKVMKNEDLKKSDFILNFDGKTLS